MTLGPGETTAGEQDIGRNDRKSTEHKTKVILNSERRELSTRNCLGIFSKEIREIDEFQLKSF